MADWLASLNLSQYTDVFQLNQLSSMQHVQHVWYLHLHKVSAVSSVHAYLPIEALFSNIPRTQSSRCGLFIHPCGLWRNLF